MSHNRGDNPALDARIYERLVAEHGKAGAARILGGPPPARRKVVPTHVGRKPVRVPAVKVKRTGVNWRDRDTKAEKAKVTIVVGRRPVKCPCGTVVPAGEEHLMVTRAASQRRYCPPCGAREAQRG